MKRCSNGHVCHDDSQTFCTQCGRMLESFTPEEKPVSNADKAESPKRRKSKVVKVLKRVLIAIVVIIGVLVLWISSKINSTTYLTFNTQNVVFPKCGGDEDVAIDYDGIVWEISYCPTWIKISEGEDSFNVFAEPNKTGQAREDHITVKSGRVVAQLPVGQLGVATRLSVDPTSVEIGRDGGWAQVSIESDGTDKEAKYPDYCTVYDFTETGFKIQAPYNSGYARDGSIVVTEDNCRAYIRFHQRGDCSSCNGRGKKNCAFCGGTGYFGYGMYMNWCSACGGSGTVTCSSCHGEGQR